MGCSCCKSKNDSNLPCLYFFYEIDNKEQESYCFNFKRNWEYQRKIRYEMKSIPNVPYCIKLFFNDETRELERKFVDNDETMKASLRKAYDLLDKYYVDER